LKPLPSELRITIYKYLTNTKLTEETGMNLVLKMAIVESGLSQRQIAAFARMSDPVLSKVIRGKESPKLDQARAIAKLLNRTLEDLWPEPAQPEVTALQVN
jgi:transcriptional regulator with XRE-family HTH domain